MSTLPKLETPTYFVEIPSSKERVKIRPFLVKEEKILLIAMQEESEEVIYEAIKQIVRNCTFDKIDINKLKLYDLEWLFLQLRIKSKGNTVELMFQCENEVLKEINGKAIQVPCNFVNTIQFDLDTIKLKEFPEHNTKVMLTDTVGIIMKHPTLDDAWRLQRILKSNDIEAIYDSVIPYVDTIFEGETFHDTFKVEDFREFLESMNDEQFDKIEQFFDTIPRLSVDIKIKCQKCGHEETVTVEGLKNFLA